MALEIDNFKEVGGNRNFTDGGQVYTLHSEDDTITTMLENDYLGGLSGTLKVRDVIILCGSDFTQMARVASNDGTTVTVTSPNGYSPAQSLSGPGAADITSLITDVTSTGADAVTLADGDTGQTKIITLIVDGGTMTLTPATALGYATIVFADAGDTVTLLFKKALGWTVIGQGGLGTGPVVTA